MFSLAKKPTRITATLVTALYQRTSIELFVGVLFALGITGIGWIAYASPWAVAWAAGILALYGMRWLVALTFRRSMRSEGDAGRWFAFLVLGAIVTGMAWGFAGAAAVQQGSMGFVAAVTVAIGCVALVTTVSYYGMLRFSASFLAPALAAPLFFLLAEPRPSNLLAGGLLCVFSLMLLSAAVLLRKGSLAAIDMSQINEALRAERDKTHDEAKRLSVALKVNTEKREQAEQELQRLSADLGLLKGKARALANTLRDVAPKCPITGLTTQKYLGNTIDSEWRRGLRENKPLSLIVFTLDDFERYQQSLGPRAAEACLKQGALAIKRFARRASDLAARFADHSFALLLPGADTRKAMQIAEEARSAVERLGIPHAESSVTAVVTVHAGVATMIPNSHITPRDLLHRVDTALYEAQFQGGNRIVVYRALSHFRKESWNTGADGLLTDMALQQKLLLLGFDGNRDTYAPQTRLPDQNDDRERIRALLAGQLRVTVEGQSMDLKPGDCLFIPPGTNCAFEVVGIEPVVCYSGTSNTAGAAKIAV